MVGYVDSRYCRLTIVSAHDYVESRQFSGLNRPEALKRENVEDGEVWIYGGGGMLLSAQAGRVSPSNTPKKKKGVSDNGGAFMNYGAITAAIDKALCEYRGKVDALATNFTARKAMVEKTLREAEGRWTPEYMAEYRAQKMPSPAGYTAEIAKLQESTRASVRQKLERIEGEIRAFFNAPIDNAFALKVSAISSAGLRLSDSEFRLLREDAHAYLELRLLQALAESRMGEKKTVPAIEGGEVTTKAIAPRDPFDIGLFPDPDSIDKALQKYKSGISTAISYYSGPNAEFAEALPPLENGERADGITAVAAADAYWRSGYRGEFEDVLARANEILPNEGALRSLTDAEEALINMIIPDTSSQFTAYRVQKVAAVDPSIRHWMENEPRFAEFLEADA